MPPGAHSIKYLSDGWIQYQYKDKIIMFIEVNEYTTIIVSTKEFNLPPRKIVSDLMEELY